MFSKHMSDFAKSLVGLREFVDLVGPFLHTKHQEVLKQRKTDLAPVRLMAFKMDPSSFKGSGVTEDSIKKEFDGKIDIDISKDKDGQTNNISIKVSGPQGKQFNEAMREMGKSEERIALLYRNSLVSLISCVECFLSQIIRTYYEGTPDALKDTDKTLSLEDLKKFGSVDDARVYLIEKKVTDLMRGSFSDWISFFKERTGLSMSYLSPYMNKLIEACERRNLLVHNNGIVNSIYLSKVDSDLRKERNKGDTITLTRKYLDERIDFFELYSLLIAAELWKKLKPTAQERAEILGDIAYNHLKASRWPIAEGLSYFMMMDKEMKEPYRLVGTLNYWQAVQRQDNWDKVKTDANAADFSAKGHRYQLGHLALLGKKQEFFAIVPIALKGKEITLEELREFPIFEGMRGDKRFAQYRGRKTIRTTKKITALQKQQNKNGSRKESRVGDKPHR
jgi:hypothetical protein